MSSIQEKHSSVNAEKMAAVDEFSTNFHEMG
jgi:hypothetical protein